LPLLKRLFENDARDILSFGCGVGSTMPYLYKYGMDYMAFWIKKAIIFFWRGYYNI
jgi:hypothetical protein